MKAFAAHPGHDGFKLDTKSGLWLPIAMIGAVVTLVMLVHALRTWRRS